MKTTLAALLLLALASPAAVQHVAVDDCAEGGPPRRLLGRLVSAAIRACTHKLAVVGNGQPSPLHPRKRTLLVRSRHVRFVPIADIARCYSITSSASNCRELGTSMPSALAVCRLMTNSNLVDCMTGRSAGLAPFRI